MSSYHLWVNVPKACVCSCLGVRVRGILSYPARKLPVNLIDNLGPCILSVLTTHPHVVRWARSPGLLRLNWKETEVNRMSSTWWEGEVSLRAVRGHRAPCAGGQPPPPMTPQLLVPHPYFHNSRCSWEFPPLPRTCSATRLCPALCDPMDCSLPGSSVRGTSQAKVLEWVASSSSRGSSWPRDQTLVSYVCSIAGRFSTTVPPRKPLPSWLTYQLLGCLLQACKPTCCPALRLKKVPGYSHRDINGLSDRGSYTSETTPHIEHRQGVAAILATQGRRRLPFIGKLTVGWLISHQGNQWLEPMPHSASG